MTLIHHANVYISVTRVYDREKYLTIQSNYTAYKGRVIHNSEQYQMRALNMNAVRNEFDLPGLSWTSSMDYINEYLPSTTSFSPLFAPDIDLLMLRFSTLKTDSGFSHSHGSILRIKTA